ncbi:MAG: hypothetical protein AMS20_00090 [Gemmatimonas sp. SG8_28]|nr:MAG: hypothetical protein AMS20_00090 [Gemmatimonas sp. SG8_28]
MSEQKIQAMATKVMAKRPEIPADRALKKAAATRTGIAAMFLGGLVCLAGFAFPVLSYFILKQEPGLMVVLLGGVVFLGGLLLFGRGAHAASGEVMENMDGFVGAIGSLLKTWRSK